MKINLGSGPNGIESWINYDWGMLPLLSKMPIFRKILIRLGILDSSYDTKWPKIKLVDIRKILPLKNESVDYIYCSNVLEHFEKRDAEKILSECYRVLKRKGIVRIVLPDLKKLIRNYSTASKFCREFYGYDKDIIGWTRLFVRGHEWMYDEKEFVKLLENAGLTNWKIRKFREGLTPDINILDLKIHEKLCMYIEAKKV